MNLNKNKAKRYTMTYLQFRKIEDELTELKVMKRKEVADKIREFREKGNLSNNQQYSNARAEQRGIEARISEIEYILKHTAVMSEEECDFDTVFLGCQVMVFDKKYDEEIVYSIVKTVDAKSLKNKISNESPMGKALLDKKVGDVVTVCVGTSTSEFEILNIVGIEPGYIPKHVETSKKVGSNEKKVDSKLMKEISPKDFITRVNVFKCTADNHNLVDIMCRIKVMSRNGKIDTHVVPGVYCETCSKYYMLDIDYKRLKQKGILVCKVVEKDFWSKQETQNNYYNLNQESLLHMMGYNVNAYADLSKEQRWGILELIVDEGILTVAEIRSHLNWLIRRNKHNHNFDDARLKWEKDSVHLMNYVSKSPITVDVDSITSKNYRTNNA